MVGVYVMMLMSERLAKAKKLALLGRVLESVYLLGR